MKKHALTLLLLLLCTIVRAQSTGDDFGIWYTLGAQKKLSQQLSISLEGEYRTRNNARTTDRWTIEAAAAWKPNRNLKIEGGYKFIDEQRQEKISYTTTPINLKHWRPSYYHIRHRVFLGAEASIQIQRFTISLRERWQYTYRPDKSVTRYDFDDERWEQHNVGAKAKHELRSRLKMEYDFPHWKLDPEVSAELFNAWRTEQIRLTIGTDYKIKKHHVIKAFYRFQINNEEGDIYDYNEHILGLGYQFRF